ncbi:Mss4-like protein [Mycena filopes]|nr:Mss4-like protein [Mycena filopes]
MSATEATGALPGSCHCGAFKFTLNLPNLTQSISSCPCRLCSRNAYLWAHPTSKSDLTVLQGEGSLTRYQYGTSVHQFCAVCGTSLLCEAQDGELAINVRALADFDVESSSSDVPTASCGITVEHKPTSPNPPSEGGLHGSCHCGGIAYTLHTPPTATKSCNCSICSRNASLWSYPLKTDVTIHTQRTLVEYTFNRKQILHGFCRTCGVSVWELFLNPAKAHTMGLNLRTVDNFASVASLPTKVHNGKATPLSV